MKKYLTKPNEKGTFVNFYDNTVPDWIQKNIKLSDNVIVTDGSYMLDEEGNSPTGIYFRKDGLYEILTVVEINKPFPTDIEEDSSLIYINNCKIQDANGKIFYCSKINLTRFKL